MSDYFDRVERQLVDRVQGSSELPDRWSRVFGVLAPVAAVVIVLVVVAVVISVGHRSSNGSFAGRARSSIVFRASAAPPHSSLGSAIDASVVTLRHRLRSVYPQLRVSRAGQQIVVTGATERMRARVLQLAVPGRLSFYDWEANALTPNGKPVAGQVAVQDPHAMTISQGAGGAPGQPGSGGLPLYQAVKLASKQPVVQPAQVHFSRSGSYYLFGAPGSAACATVAQSNGTIPIRGEHCLLAGPDAAPQNLRADLPAGVTVSDGEQLIVPQGTVVLQAASASAARQIKPDDQKAQFYVLRDNVSLAGTDTTNPRPSTDESGSPAVTFGFDPAGEKAFQHITATLAHRGVIASSAGQVLNQHFAVALDTQLITVASIDFKTYPDGITGGGGADITSLFTSQSARDLAAILRSGPLAVNLALR